MASLLDLSQLTARTDRAGLVRAPIPASPYVTDNVRLANSARQALIEARKKRLLPQAMAAIQDIENLAAHFDSLKYIEEHKLHRDVIDCLKEFPAESRQLQCAAYASLLVLSGRTQKLRMSIQINQDLLRHLTETLECLIDNGPEMTQHLSLLLELLCSVQLAGPLRRCLWRHEKIISFAKSVFSSADRFDTQEQTVLVVRASALLLDTYHCSSSWADHVTRFFCDQHARLAALLARRCTVEFCMRALCPLFRELCHSSAQFRRQMLADGVHRQLADSVRQLCCRHTSMPDLLALNVDALCRLHCQTVAASAAASDNTDDAAAAAAAAAAAVPDAVRDSGLLNELLRVLLRYPDRHPSLQLACFTLYTCSIDRIYCTAAADQPAAGGGACGQFELDWLRTMQLGFLHYAHDEEISQVICKALAKLLRWRPEFAAQIGDEPNQYPIHTYIRLQFSNKDHKPRLMVALFDAVFWMAVQNERMQSLLAQSHDKPEDGIPMLIVGCLTLHADNEDVYYYGIRALRALCVFSKERKLSTYLNSCMGEEHSSRLNVLDIIGRSFHRFRTSCHVLTEAVTLLACLADVDLIRHQCLIPKPSSIGSSHSYHGHAHQQPALHKELLELLRDCQGNREFVEAGLECLCILAAAGFETDTELAILDLLVPAMAQHRGSYLVQKCGLILLQLLPKEFPPGEDAAPVCAAVVQALRAFPKALGVQAEGCVAVLLLSQRSPRLAQGFVQQDAYECLLHIMRTSMKKRGLLRLAAEGLHEIIVARDLKDAVLVRAIRNGHIKMARCLLELGANPNATEGSEPPICLALSCVKQPGDLLDIVNCLLEKGAVNTQSALEKSLALNADMVTGLLLKYLGYYKQGNFGSVTWCNLKLQNFQARWLDAVIKPRSAEQELSDIRIRKVSKLIREARTTARPRSSSAAGMSVGFGTAAAADSDINPERYRLTQWSGRVPPAKASGAFALTDAETETTDDEAAPQQPVPAATTRGGRQRGRTGSVVSALFAKMPPFFRRADSFGEVRDRDSLGVTIEDSAAVEKKKKLSDGGRSASMLGAAKMRRSTVAPEVLAAQIKEFRQRRETIRSDPDESRAPDVISASPQLLPLPLPPPPPPQPPAVIFAAVDGELQEFYQSTLSSSNLPYSCLDPRLAVSQQRAEDHHHQHQHPHPHSQPLEVRRGSCLLRCPLFGLESDAVAAAGGAAPAAYVTVSESFNDEFDDDVDVEDDDDEDSNSLDEASLTESRRPGGSGGGGGGGGGGLLAVPSTGRRIFRVSSSQPFTTTEDSASEMPVDDSMDDFNDATSGGGVGSEVGEEVTRRRRELRSRQSRSNTASHISAFKPAARQEQLRLIDLSANCIANVDSLSLVEADIDLQMSLAFLSRLSVANNKLTHLPQGVFPFLSNLAHVELNGNRLADFPYELITSCRLEFLDVSDNDIVELREERLRWVGAVFTLRELLVSRNKLVSVPMRFLENLYGLEKLRLNGNQIRELEAQPLQLKRLKCFSLANNYIRCIPDEFLSSLVNLEEFDASYNELESLPSPETARRLYHLSTVRLSNNQLGTRDPLSVPDFILHLSTLKSVDLSYNHINNFPSPRSWASSVLREVDMSHNVIETLNLKGGDRWSKTLERFGIAYNDLKTLHSEIGLLESLASLDVSHNPSLTSLPDEVGNLSKLWEMPLDGLKLSLDQSVIRGRTKDLVGYFHQKLNKSVSHYRMKLMLVGFGGRGKTSLLRALMKQKQQERNVPTVGIAVTPWVMRVFHRKLKWVRYRLSCWDFAGQEDFYSTHQCFLSQRALYLLIYSLQACVTPDGCDSELRRLRPWLVNIKAQAPGCPVICVGTHADTLPRAERDAIVADMRARVDAMVRRPGFTEIAEYVEVNATRDNATVERLRGAVQTALETFKVKGHHVMGQMVPESYVRLEELVMERARNPGQDLPVLEWYQLRKMATDAGLNMNDEKLSQAVRFLHESGVLLHFDDSTYRLNNLYFIDPQWLCRMMAQIVTVKEINGFIRSGVMRQSDLSLLFTGKRITEEDRQFIFPSTQIPQYLRILEKFEIVLPQKNDELLIPCRLPDFGPRDLADFGIVRRYNNLVTRLYEMPFIPIGFWPRLVARMYNIIDQIYPSHSRLPCAPTILEMGKRGMFAFWKMSGPGAASLASATAAAAAASAAASDFDEAFFLLQTYEEDKPEGGEGLQLQVPLSPNGAYLLAQVADNVDVVVEEWYPGLTDRTVTGECVLQKRVPCVSCCGQLNVSSSASASAQLMPCQAMSASPIIVPLAS